MEERSRPRRASWAPARRRPSRPDVPRYIGTLDDGTEFDRGTGFRFTIGDGDVIKGWDRGIVGMKVGGRRKLVVPSKLGYGKKGSAPEIPPNATLHFDCTLERIIA